MSAIDGEIADSALYRTIKCLHGCPYQSRIGRDKMDDLIRRQDAIAEFNRCELTPDGGIDVNDAIDFLKHLPPAQPEQRWIPCSERLPKNREWVLGIFQEGDTGWINPIPFICDYVGKKTPITTQDNWLLKMVDEPHPYYKELHCIAWMPLPEPYNAERRTDGEETDRKTNHFKTIDIYLQS